MTNKPNRKEIADGLRKYNLWRRDQNVPSIYEMPDPKELGVWIDGAIEELEKNNTDHPKLKPHERHLYNIAPDGTYKLKGRYKKYEKEINERREHDTDSEDCWCQPTIEEHKSGKVIIHNRPN